MNCIHNEVVICAESSPKFTNCLLKITLNSSFLRGYLMLFTHHFSYLEEYA